MSITELEQFVDGDELAQLINNVNKLVKSAKSIIKGAYNSKRFNKGKIQRESLTRQKESSMMTMLRELDSLNVEVMNIFNQSAEIC